MPAETETNQLKKDVQELKTSGAVTEQKLLHITQSIDEIKNNHLLHINDTLTVLDRRITDNHTLTTTLINEKLGEIYKKITDLSIVDAKQQPTQNILTKVIEYVIIAVVGAVIALVVSHT